MIYNMSVKKFVFCFCISFYKLNICFCFVNRSPLSRHCQRECKNTILFGIVPSVPFCCPALTAGRRHPLLQDVAGKLSHCRWSKHQSQQFLFFDIQHVLVECETAQDLTQPLVLVRSSHQQTLQFRDFPFGKEIPVELEVPKCSLTSFLAFVLMSITFL